VAETLRSRAGVDRWHAFRQLRPSRLLRPAGPCHLRSARFADGRSRQAVGSAPRSFSFRLAVPKPYHCFPSELASLARKALSSSSGAFFRLAEARPSDCSFRTAAIRPNDCAPLTASAVRQVHSEERTRRVFRYCCGHRCRYRLLEFLFHFQAVKPERLDHWLSQQLNFLSD
jgi:hypothetical protein